MRQIKRLLPVFLVAVIAVCMAFAFACAKKYTVTFDSDGGSVVASQTVTNGQKAEKPEDPTKAGYEFVGWFLGETKYDFETEVTSDITLKAHWNQNIVQTTEYTVTYDADGGSAVTAQKIKEGGKATKPADPTKAGYTFAGWYNGTAEYKFTETVTGNITLKAHWTLNEYTVTYDADGGSAVTAAKVNHGAKVTKPADPTKTGYSFAGWYNGETEYDFQTAVTGNLTLKAHWTINEYTVTYDADGGSAVTAAKVNHGAKVTKPADPAKTGYTFAGWYNGETEYDFQTAVTGNLTLKAHWTLNEYTVTYDADGGSAVASVKVNHGSTVTAPKTQKWGYEFAGWYNGATAYDFETAVTGNLTLTAHWTPWETLTEDSEVQLTDIIINTDDVKKAYNIGEQLNTEGLKVWLTSVNADGVVSNYNVSEEDWETKVSIDSSEYNAEKEGTYTIYVTYTHSGISRHASYKVTVTSVISGIHGIIIEKEVTVYDITVEGDPEAIPVDDIKVYSANEDGTKGAEITEGVTYEYYLGNKKVELSTLTTQNARVYQIWANVNYTVGTETYVMSNFVLIRVNGNNITKMEFVSEGATTSQTQGYSDLMSSTWKFNVEYRLGQAGTIDLSTAEPGTEIGQYTLSNFSPAVIGAGVATLTYYYAVGTEKWEYSAEVPYSVYPVTQDTSFEAHIDFGTADASLNHGEDTYYNFTSTIKKGAELVPLMVYANTGSDLSLSSEAKDSAVSDEPALNDRIQLNNGSKSLVLSLAGPATITVKARTGNSTTKGKVALKQGDTVIAESEEFNNTSKYQTFTVKAPSAGEYVLIFNASGSLNTYYVGIVGTILGPTVSLSANDVAVTDDDTVSSVTLSEDFTLVAKSGKAVNVGTCDPITIGGQTFTKQINLKGAGAKDNRHIAFAIPEITGKAKVTVYASHGGSADELRALELCKADGTPVASANVVKTGSIVEFEITEAGSYYVRSASSGQLIYYIALTYQVAEVA